MTKTTAGVPRCAVSAVCLIVLFACVACGSPTEPSGADATPVADTDSGIEPTTADAGDDPTIDAGPSPDSWVGAIPIPDPGTGEADWQCDYEGNFTPQTAFRVGVVTETMPYILAYIEQTTGDVFYVFRTGPDFTRLDVDLWGNKADVTAMHLHQGTGLVFGAMVPDTRPEILLGGWDLTADTVYVLEINTAGGGFV